MASARPPRLLFKDWVLLTVGIGFVVMSLLIWRVDRDKAMVMLALFGFCTAIVVWTARHRHMRQKPRSAAIVGSAPIRPLRGQLLFVSSLLAMPGAAIVLFGGRAPLSLKVIGWGLTFFGSALAAAVITRHLPAGYVQFDPEGITFGKRTWRYLVPWDVITRIRTDELGELPVLYLSLRDPSCVVVHPPSLQLRAARELAKNQRRLGAHVMLMPLKYGLDLPVLLKTVRNCVQDPAYRATLA